MFPYRPDERRQTIEDPARGARAITHDERGRITEVAYAGGGGVRLERDAAGRLTRVDADGALISIDETDARCLRVTDGDGATVVERAPNGYALRRAGVELAFEWTSKGRLRRVTLPGSDGPLEYRWRPGGGCSIGGAIDVEPLSTGARLTAAGRVVEERRLPLGVRLSSNAAAVEIGWDTLGRTTQRRWHDGFTERFERAAGGRLSAWSHGARTRRYIYERDELVAEEESDAVWRRAVDGAGRVHRLSRPDGSAVEYEYDGRGRRIRANDRRYRYDGLGQLTATEAEADIGGGVRFRYDGLGRRVAVCTPAGTRFEHRDLEGRLWAITDERGRATATFIWHEGRLLARIDGPVGDPLAELFLTDHAGSLLGLVEAAGHSAGIDRRDQPPYGRVESALRPTLYGHFGDAETGLIFAGTRFLDPELGLFLTPDPWDGARDDPRRWSDGASGAALGREVSFGGLHPYALCQFDPAGLVDGDGHQSTSPRAGLSVLKAFLALAMEPTWGWPLTAVSLFVLFPIDLYLEVVALLFTGFARLISSQSGFWVHHPWESLSVFRSVLAMSSSRQGVLALGLNGFLPSFLAGGFSRSSERAVTIGNVVWVDRAEINRMERPTVLLLDNLTGLNIDPAKRSIVLIEGTEDGKKQLHASYWSRGFGNVVRAAGGSVSFDDVANGGTTRAPLHLALPPPLDFPSGDELTGLQEYIHTPATDVVSEARVVRDAFFALRVPTGISLQVGDPIEVTADLSPPQTVHLGIADIQHDKDFSTLILSGALPAAFQDKNLTLWRVRPVPGAADTVEWKAGANSQILVSPAPAAGADQAKHDAVLAQPIAIDTLLRITGSAPAPAAGAPPGAAPPAGLSVQYARVTNISVALQLSTPLAGPLVANDPIQLLEVDGDTLDATLPDPAKGGSFKWKGSHDDIHDGDTVTVAAGNAVTFGVVQPSAGDALELALAAPALTVGAGAAVRVRKVKDKEGDDQSGKVVTGAADNIPVSVKRLGTFAKNLWIRAKGQVRTIAGLGEVVVTVAEPQTGTPDFKVAVAQIESSTKVKGAKTAKLFRFLEFTGTAGMQAPSAFGQYPDFVINVGMKNIERSFFQLSRSFAQSNANDFSDTFHAKWKPASASGKEYFVLEADLPYEESDSKVFWRFDPDTHGDNGRNQLPSTPPDDPFLVTILQFQKAGRAAARAPAQFSAEEPQVLVPEYPSVADTHAESLRQHEMRHARQNNYPWGPLLVFTPVALIERLVELAGDDPQKRAAWLASSDDEKRKAVDQFKGAQWASVGSILQLTWMYLFTFGKANSVKFEGWNRLFSPFIGNIIHAYPDLDPNAPLSEKPGSALLQILNTFSDLRSWFPFFGLIPVFAHGGARNFLEQQASRASGDCYSTLLTANDEFNVDTGLSSSTAANLTKSIGQVVRLLLFPAFRDDRVLLRAFSNQPGSPISYTSPFTDLPPLEIKSTVDVLVHPDLLEASPAAALGAPVALPGPSSLAAPVTFTAIVANSAFTPSLRSLVPVPLGVNRTLGCYFIPITPATYDCTAFDAGATAAPADRVDAKTQVVHLTFGGGDIKLDTDPVAYVQPAPAAPASTFDRFVGEAPQLTINGQPFKDAVWWEVNVTDTAGAALPADFVKTTALGNGWKLTIAKALPAAAANQAVRVRIFRIFRKNDAADDTKNDPVFDLTFDPKKHPTLRNVRSYLEKDIWIPVRDFVFTVQPIPPLAPANPPASVDTEQEFLLNLALPLPKDVKPVTALKAGGPPGAPVRLTTERTGIKGTQPRGEQWRVKPLGPVLEDPATYRISVTYAPGVSPSPLDLKITPHIAITKAAGQADFVATEAAPCQLAIAGGAGPYVVSTEGFPAGCEAKLNGDAGITVTVKNLQATTKGVVVVTDHEQKKGRRTVTLKK